MVICNKCRLKKIRDEYGGQRYTVRTRRGGINGGITIYAIPKGEKMDKEKYFVTWLAEIPDRCEC